MDKINDNNVWKKRELMFGRKGIGGVDGKWQSVGGSVQAKIAGFAMISGKICWFGDKLSPETQKMHQNIC